MEFITKKTTTKEQLAVIEYKLDNIHELLKELKKEKEDLGKRVTKIEHAQTYVKGSIASVMLLAPMFSTVLMKFLGV